MRKVGFDGGHTLYELGPVSDVVLFFECLGAFVASRNPNEDWSLLTDRLYRRYLRREELEPSLTLMERARRIFAMVPSNHVEWDENLLADRNKTWLDAKQDTLANVFSRYFDLFSKAKDSAVSFSDSFGIYKPVRVIVSGVPELIIEEMRPLNEYDELNLSDLPFWLR